MTHETLPWCRFALRLPVRFPNGLISAGSGVQAGQQMFTLSNISSVWITANVPQQQLGVINIGSIAAVTTTALGDKTINARVTYIDPGVNEDTRTAKVRLAVDNPGERLTSRNVCGGRFSDRNKFSDGRKNSLLIPKRFSA